MADPYRSSARATRDAGLPTVEGGWACGELTIAILLGAVGALGIGLGIWSSASERALSVGLLLVLLGTKVAWDYRRAHHERATPPTDPPRR